MSLGAQDYERNIWVVFSVRTQRAHFLQVTEGTKSDWRPDLWMVPKCHAVPCNVQEDLGSTLLDGYQSGECECRHFLAFHSHYLCYFGVHCKRAEGLQVRRSAAERTGRTPGLPPAKNTSWYNQGDFHRHQPSTPASQPRTCSGLCLREGECGKKKKAKVTGKAQQARERSSRARRRATERREPSSGRGSRAAARDPLKAGGDRHVASHPHQGRKPRRRPHESRPPTPRRPAALTSCPGRSSPRHWLGNSWSTSWTPAAQPPAATSPTGAAGPRAGAARAPPDPPSAVGSRGTRVRRRRPPGPRACRRREETTPETPPLGPRLCPEEASPRSWAGAVKTARPGGHRRVAGAAECPVDLKDPGAVHFRFRGGARAAEAEVTRRGSEAWALALPRVHRGER